MVMAVFKFIGDAEGHGPNAIRLFGIEFPKGTAVEVKEDAAISKLNGNGHFEEVKPQRSADGNRRRSPK